MAYKKLKKSYSCDYCFANNYVKNGSRICYSYDSDYQLYDDFSEVTFPLVFPVLDDEVGYTNESEVIESTEAMLLEKIGDLQFSYGEGSVFNWLLDIRQRAEDGKDKGQVCPVSLFLGRYINGVHIDELGDWQSAAEDYNSLPAVGGWLDQKKWICQALSFIKSGKNSASNDIQDDMLKKTPK